MTEAGRHGYHAGKKEWVNFGQGQPETGPLPGGPERIREIKFGEDCLEYAPVAGVGELRQAVADYYNRTYRRGCSSQYTAENVCIASGGRAALTRTAAALGQINLGHFLPDYTAYEELLDVFKAFNPIPILLEAEKNYEFTIADLKREITGRGLGALLRSNPCNPTGKLIAGEELKAWVEVAGQLSCTMLFDEFYSHYIWNEDDAASTGVSAAKYVEDVNVDPIVIFDGLTKNWRYPGWRVAWILGPKAVINAVSSTGSFLDGGGTHPLQMASVGLLRDEIVKAETESIRKAFASKRRMLIDGLKELGISTDGEPQGTFYVWGNISSLPNGLKTGMEFFRAALDHKMITVPGEFFGVDPGGRRRGRPSQFRHYSRFSFGAPYGDIASGLERIAKMIEDRRQPTHSGVNQGVTLESSSTGMVE
jgi:aspartate/methionine/tyrosine aminotransferase